MAGRRPLRRGAEDRSTILRSDRKSGYDEEQRSTQASQPGIRIVYSWSLL